MKSTKLTGLLTRKKAVRYLIYLLLVCVFAVFVIRLNQVEKTELVVRTGQTFEKAKVVKILQDNLEENGTRVGEQKVRVHMLTGVRKGEELDITSSSGYLFGAACKPGMKVIVMQSVAGDSTVASVYTQDRESVIYIFALIYLLALCMIGGKQGIKGCLGLVFTFFCVIFVYLPLGVSEILTVLDRSVCMFYYDTGYHVSYRRSYTKNVCRNAWNSCRSSSCRDFQHGVLVRHLGFPDIMYRILRR